MNKINFEPIGEAMKAFDTDIMDIYRVMEITNPDGTTGETTRDEPLYEKVPCHIAFETVDNPDTKTQDTQPTIMNLVINCSLDVDIENGDYVIGKKLSNNKTTLETYKGIVGEPAVSQSRKTVKMIMRTDV